MNVDHRFTQTQHQYAADDLETMSEAVRYQKHIFALVRPYLGQHVLEVGCGIGTMSRQILDVDARLRLACIEPNAHCASAARVALAGEPRVAIRECHLEECSHAELQQERFDTIVCVNVLEHIEDDVRAVTLFRDVLAGTNGQVIVFVPALQSIYGPHDAALGHHRRYSKRSLAQTFAAAGLDMVRIRYTNPIGLLGWL
jgi:2-polyprenyl-3-methyl-5-hydroxy-6-metoxy-1,4-benzoquinol methylase